jgi:hypothetical protein
MRGLKDKNERRHQKKGRGVPYDVTERPKETVERKRESLV